MRLVLINQFYPPDAAPTGVYLHAVAAALVRRGHAVTVLCSRRGYDGCSRYPRRAVLEGVEVIRLPACGFGRGSFVGKLLDYASFFSAVTARLLTLTPRPDAALALTTPPFAGLLVRLAAAVRGIVPLHWVMDVYPDVLAAHGTLAAHTAAYRALQGLARVSLRGSPLVLTLGPDMAARLQTYVAGSGSGQDTRPDPVRWLPLWAAGRGVAAADLPDILALRRARGWQDDTLVLMYSGNIGRGHRVDEFLALAGTDDPEYDRLRLRIVFSGAGPRMRAVRRFAAEHPSARLEIMGPVSADCLGVHLRSADILLASLELAWTGCLLPSKVQAALAAGRPVLFVGDARSAIATWLRESGGGWVVAPGDLGALKRAVVDAAQPAVRERMGRAAAAFAAQRFDAVAGPLTLCAWIEAAVAGAQRRLGA